MTSDPDAACAVSTPARVGERAQARRRPRDRRMGGLVLVPARRRADVTVPVLRTAWLVPLGAVLATSAPLGRLASVRVRDPEPLGARETWMLGVIVLPVVLLLTLPARDPRLLRGRAAVRTPRASAPAPAS